MKCYWFADLTQMWNSFRVVVSSISVTVVPNPNDHTNCDGQSDGPLENIREVSDRKSKWEEVKEDPLFCAVK